MFIPRKTRKISNVEQHQDYNFSEGGTLRKQTGDNEHGVETYDLQLSSHPCTQYLIGSILVGFSIYLFYSASGAKNSIPGFNENKWWQYLIAIIPLLCAFLVFIVVESEWVFIIKNHNKLLYEKKRLFCFKSQQVSKQLSDINGIALTKKPNSSASYCISINFKTCQSLQILPCVYQSSAREYFQKLTHSFTSQQISQHRILIQDLNPEN